MSFDEIKILALEDNDFDFDLVRRKLKGLGSLHILRRATSELEFKKYLQEFSPDVILSDFSIPSWGGMNALQLVKVSYPGIPFIFVSGTIGEEVAVESLKKGAVDYVLKGNLNKLVPAVKRALDESKEKIKRKEAEEKLKIKIRELRTLIYRISHDIKGPLCTIRGATGLSRELAKRNFGDVVDCMGIIDKVVSRMDSILFNLSSFQFIYQEEDLQFSHIDLNTLLQELEVKLSSIEGFRKVKLNTRVVEDKPYFCERNFIFFILYNLIHNSITFYDEAKQELFVDCSIRSGEGGIEIVVTDNGMGMSEEVLNNAFNMFYRGHEASKGAGLGLYIIKNGLELLKGTIDIESKQGVGTTVRITIPQILEDQSVISFI